MPATATNKRMPTLSLSWRPDDKLEDDLQRMAVAYDVVLIQLADIDFRESQVNGARIGESIIHDTVEDYMEGMRIGDRFPRVVIHKGTSGYVVLSGNQRCEAIRRLAENGEVKSAVEIEAYRVDTPDKMLLDLVARTGNVAHGKGDTKEHRMQHALYFIRNHGLTTKDAAKYFIVSEATINHRLRSEEQRTYLGLAGIDASSIPGATLEPLSKLDGDESAKLNTARLIVRHRPTAERVRQVVSVLAKQSNSQARAKKIKEFEKELTESAHETNGHHKVAIEKSKVPQRPRRDKFIGLATRLVNFLECDNAGESFTSLDEMQITTKADIAKATDLIKRLQFRLKVLSK